MKGIIFAICLMVTVGFTGVRVFKYIVYDIGCEGRLKRAADANTVSTAQEELRAALDYAKANRLTSGYTSIIYETPDEDLGFWYKNLTEAHDELAEIPAEATLLERSNALMKLRETILDDSGKGVSVTAPVGISIFPFNTAFAAWAVLAVLGLIVGVVVIFVWIEDH